MASGNLLPAHIISMVVHSATAVADTPGQWLTAIFL